MRPLDVSDEKMSATFLSLMKKYIDDKVIMAELSYSSEGWIPALGSKLARVFSQQITIGVLCDVIDVSTTDSDDSIGLFSWAF